MSSKNIAQAVHGTLGTQLLSGFMQIVRTLPKIWAQTGQSEQQMAIERARLVVEQAVTGAVGRIARADFKAVPVKIEGISLKAETKVTIALEGDGQLHDLIDYRGKRCLLVFIDPEKHLEGMEVIRADADQPELPLGTPLVDSAPPVDPTALENAGEGDVGFDDGSLDHYKEPPPPENPATLGEAEPETVDGEEDTGEDTNVDALEDDDEDEDALNDALDAGGGLVGEEAPADAPPMTRDQALDFISTCDDVNDVRFAQAKAVLDATNPTKGKKK